MKLTVEGSPEDIKDFLNTGDNKKVKVVKDIEEKSNFTRQQIVESAKADIKNITCIAANKLSEEGNGIYRFKTTTPRFNINREKRTIVALAYGINIPTVCAKGKAKCMPGDIFNAWLGKAIAVRRAYGLPVPEEYLNVPKPEGVEIGDIVQSTNNGYVFNPYKVWSIINNMAFDGDNKFVPICYLKVIDDTDRRYR